jgi:hypothetical protein
VFKIKNNNLTRTFPLESFGGMATRIYDPTKAHYSARLCRIKYSWGRYQIQVATVTANSEGLIVVQVTGGIESINSVECGGYVFSEGLNEILQPGEYRYDRQTKLLYARAW